MEGGGCDKWEQRAKILVTYSNLLNWLALTLPIDHMESDQVEPLCEHIRETAKSIMNTIDVTCDRNIRKNISAETLSIYTDGYNLLLNITASDDLSKILGIIKRPFGL